MELITFLVLAIVAASLMCFYLIRLLGKKEMDHDAEVVDIQKDLDFYKYKSGEILSINDSILEDNKASLKLNDKLIYKFNHHQKQHKTTIHKLNNDINKLKRQVKRSRKDAYRTYGR